MTLRFSVATDARQVEALRPVWENLGGAELDSDLDYLLTVAAHADQVVSPYIVHIQRDGHEDLLVSARLENLPVRIRLGYWLVAQPRARAIVVTFGGVLGARNGADCADVVNVLTRLLDGGTADLVLMRNVDPHKRLHATSRRIGGALRFAHWQRRDPIWTAPVPESLDAFLAGRSARTRSTYRRQERLLREAFGDRLRMRHLSRPEELDVLCRDMAAVAQVTYQAGLGAGFSDTPMERALLAHALARDAFRCWMLDIDDRPVAFWAGTRDRTTFHTSTPGFDPQLAQHSVGRYTMFRMIEDLCRERMVERIDFGRGSARYKMEFASPTREATDVWLAARRPRAMALVAALSLSAGLDRTLRRLLDAANVSAGLKGFWRRRLASRAPKVPAT